MRAALLYGPDDLRIEGLAAETPGPGELVVRVEAALTCATDVKMWRRGHPALGAYPARFGHEWAGTVTAAGEGAPFPPGERVVVADSAPCGTCAMCRRGQENLCPDLQYLFGGFAEAVRVPARHAARNTYRVPADVPAEVVAMADPLACALRAADVAAVRAAERVLVLGAGPTGLLVTWVASRRGASVTVSDPHQARLAQAGRFGASATYPRTGDDSTDEAAMRDLRGADGPDLVIEAVGRPAAWEQAVRLARRGGRVCLFGGCARGTVARFPTERLHYDEVTVLGAYHHAPRYFQEAVAALVGGLVPADHLLGERYRLDDLAVALRNMEATRERSVKHVVVP